MNLPAFDYHAPRKLEELFALLAAHRGKSRVLAGGTDLLVAMKLRQLRPEVLIDLREIKNLRGIAWDGAKGLSIGAENLQAAESLIRDVDLAAQMVEFVKDQILVQSSTAMLAQANTKPQTVLQLFR